MMEVLVPSLGESVAEGMIARWLREDGDFVQVDDPLLELETDKATMEIVAQGAGALKIVEPEGTTVSVGTVIGQIDESAKGPATGSQASATVATSSPKTEPASEPDRSQRALSPSVRKMVSEHNLDPSQIAASGPGGRLTKADIQKHLDQLSSASQPTPPSVPASTIGAPDNQIKRVPMSMLRRRIAERLVAAQRDSAILSTFNEIDMSAVISLRKKYKESFKEKYGISLGFMSFFGKACIDALKEVPAVGARIDGTDLVFHEHVHLGIAVSTERGLVVPVIRFADQMEIHELESAIADMAKRARDAKITPDDLTGGTFTISNGGVFGSLLSTPILNPPQSGILGMHKIEERPIAINGEVVVRPMMYVALSYDHRVIDGKESVTFLVKVKERVEDPQRLLLGV